METVCPSKIPRITLLVIMLAEISLTLLIPVFKCIVVALANQKPLPFSVWMQIAQPEWVAFALLTELIVLWATATGRRWAWPFIFILLINASCYVTWSLVAWADLHSVFRAILIMEAIAIPYCFGILITSRKVFGTQVADLIRAGVAIALAGIFIFIKGARFSPCCPQYNRIFPEWWVILDISGLWNPQEKGLLMCWIFYVVVTAPVCFVKGRISIGNQASGIKSPK